MKASFASGREDRPCKAAHRADRCTPSSRPDAGLSAPTFASFHLHSRETDTFVADADPGPSDHVGDGGPRLPTEGAPRAAVEWKAIATPMDAHTRRIRRVLLVSTSSDRQLRPTGIRGSESVPSRSRHGPVTHWETAENDGYWRVGKGWSKTGSAR